MVTIYHSIQAMGEQCKSNSIQQIRLQLVSIGLIGNLNQIDQFEKKYSYTIYWNSTAHSFTRTLLHQNHYIAWANEAYSLIGKTHSF